MAKWQQSPIFRDEEQPKWQKSPPLVSPERARPLQRQPEAPLEKEGLAIRGLKQFTNILPETAKETLYGLGGGKIASFVTAGLLNRRLKKMGIKAPSLRETQKLVKQSVLKRTGIPEFEVTPPTTIGEKAVDITAGIGKFVTKLAVLRKVLPGAPEAALWEMENISSGGAPGMGYALHGAFTAPGKIIKGVTLPAKAGRLLAESVSLASISAIEQKIDTGEIDPVQIGIAAGIPVALRTPRAIKKLIRARNPKVINAVAVAHPEILGRLPEQRALIQAGKKSWSGFPLRKDIGEMPTIRDVPPTRTTKGDFILYHGTSDKAANKIIKSKTILPDDIGSVGIGTTPEAVTTFAVHKIGKGKPTTLKITISKDWLSKQELRHEGGGHDSAFLIIPKGGVRANIPPNAIKDISILSKPVTIDTANKTIAAWSTKAKLLNQTERKAAVQALRRRQAAAGKERYKLEREAGTPRLLAFRRAKKAYKGKAAVPEIEPLKLTPEQQDLYGRRIEQTYPAEYQFQRTGAAEAITKMTEGRIPTNYEFGLLEPIFGRDATKKLFGELIKKRPFSGWELPALIIQGFKTKFGLDIQMFRQARSMAVRHPVLYLKSSWVNARAYVSNKYAERMFTQVKNSAGYMESEKLGWNYVGEAGYSSKRLEYYALGLTERLVTSKSKYLRAWGKLLGASERGAVAGINNMQKGLYDIAAKNVRRLNLTPAQQKLWMKNRAKTNNTFIKILRVPPGKQYQGLRKLKQVANYLLFSPSMTIGRPLSIKALVANKGSRKYAAGVIASNIASIFAITSIPAIIGHQMRLQNPEEEPDVNGELNILDGNWGKIRYGKEMFDFSGGDSPFYRTVARIGVSAYMYGKEGVTGKVVTEVAGRRVPDAGDTLKRYIETRETAALGYAETMLTGKDWMGEPIPRLEATIRALSPELIEATVEAGMADGLWGSLATFAAASTSVGVTTYPVKAAATRSKFRDIVSQTKHGKDWDELSMREQNRLRSEHRKQFEVLSERVRKERVGKPISIERIKEEELRAGKRIAGMLSKPNRQWVDDISIGVSRRPKNWYLNDKRYNRYQELVAQFVDERLSRIDFTGMEEKRRIARVQVIVKVAKNKALSTLRREVGR